jgi:hypothetical protein
MSIFVPGPRPTNVSLLIPPLTAHRLRLSPATASLDRVPGGGRGLASLCGGFLEVGDQVVSVFFLL